MRVWPGRPYPLGATWDGEGVNFAVFSMFAEAVEVCLFSRAPDATETHRIRMRERTHGVWHCYLPDVRPGQLYGLRVHGPYQPLEGLRFNPYKLLIDPYAKAIGGAVVPHDVIFGYTLGHPDRDLSFDERDSAPYVPKSVVVDDSFSWGNDRPPSVPWNRTVIYECHVKGLTIQHPDVPPEQRGTYLGLASEPIIDHLTALGVTTVELMPVHQSFTEHTLSQQGLSNYWGYNSIGFFAPEARFAANQLGEQVAEFKTMIKRLHSAGIEVILDVVYNHTGEGSHLGPTLSLRGIDNPSYYRLMHENRRYYQDFTGCGNRLNMLEPRTIQLIMDSLRYWVREMHVDGFRFDLAPALARELFEVNRLGRFFAIIQQDPVISQTKLIAEPWDLGEGGYQVGNFPQGWAEWNGRYRDTLRRFWRGDAGQVPELASRLSGSSDIFMTPRRLTYGSINFVACHDGFTLHDLVTYEQKHNETNGEKNQDGHNENLSRNWGAEGPTDESAIVELREQIKRNFIAALAFSQGVPMITAGDELGRTQQGNNNAYCQDNEINWIDWRLNERARRLLSFTQTVFAIRASNAVLRRKRFFLGAEVGQLHVKDVTWINPEGGEMSDADWHDHDRRCLGMMISGEATDEVDERGRVIIGDTILMLVNGGDAPLTFRLPVLEQIGNWRQLVDTARPGLRVVRSGTLVVPPHALILLVYELA